MSNSAHDLLAVRDSDVAIIGMHCRVPGARDVEQFWRNLRAGVESVVFSTDEELRAAGIAQEILSDPHYVKARAPLDDIAMFDAAFFGFSPREAEAMDPQQRLFLECAWELMEIAGYGSLSGQNLVGVYAGVGTNHYVPGVLSNEDLTESLGKLAIVLANDKDSLATNVSYKLNLKGPSFSVQTACSTSLVAVHLACQALFAGECDIALAGGVSLDVSQRKGYLHKDGDILSPDGHCRAFDARAQGTIPGSGVGVVLMKRLADALADGDTIHAVIKGSAINNDGSSKVGYTAPSIEGQTRVIRAAQALADVAAESVSYIEAHGTGTSLGDPIEMAALTEAFRATTKKAAYCAIGSVKTNIGHLGAAAGVAGLIKAVLALRYKQIPASLNFESPNPKIDFESSPFFVNTQLREWHGPRPLRAGVSSFGMGGTNAHVILEEPPERETSGPSRTIQLLVLSARTEIALQQASRNLVQYLKEHEEVCLPDVAYTLQLGRKSFPHRQSIVCSTREEAVSILEGANPERIRSAVTPEGDRKVVFLFPGQGAQCIRMGWQLYTAEAAFRKVVDECCEFLKPIMGLDLRKVMYPSSEHLEEAADQLKRTAITQPALFVIEYSLSRLWMEWGIIPQAMIGHSVGEYVAACLAGVMRLEDALKIIAVRGQLMQQMPPGSMLAIELSEEAVQPLLGSELSLAGVNGPRQCVVAGPSAAIDELQNRLQAEGITCRLLATSHAFHSHMMEPVLRSFHLEVRKIKLGAPHLPYISNRTGEWISQSETTDPEYWVKHLREPVRFAPGIEHILKTAGQSVFLEVGPGQTLSGLVRQNLDPGSNAMVFSSLPAAKQNHEELPFLLDAVGKLWLAGASVDWRGFYAQEKRHYLPLPPYPFERQRYWVDVSPQRNGTGIKPESHDKKTSISEWLYLPFWKPSVISNRPWKREEKLKWLVFLDEEGLGTELVQQLAALGQTVTTVQPGDHFLQLSEKAYCVRPQQPEDYTALMADLHQQDSLPHRIVHLWGVTVQTIVGHTSPLLDRSQHLGFYSVAFLARALGEQKPALPIQIVVVSSNMHSVTGAEQVHPEKATVLGPCRVIPQEYPHLNCRSVDLILAQPGTRQREKLLQQLMTELASESSDSTVAYRDQNRWVESFEPLHLEKPASAASRLRERGVYLLTGGLGNIGLAIAEHYARCVKARLVLVGRSPFPEESQWKQWLASHDAQDAVCKKIRRLQALQDLGAEVLIAHADSGNLEQMQNVVALTHERFGQIHGVIHAAGHVGDSLVKTIEGIDAAHYETHFRPKVRGLLVLEEVLQHEPLDFCLLCSSLASLACRVGSSAYSAVNLFMDAFTWSRRHQQSLVWTSVNWDVWNVGIEDRAEGANRERLLSMELEEGLETLDRILQLDCPAQVVNSTANLHARLRHWAHPGSSRSPVRKGSETDSGYQRPALSTAYVAPTNETEVRICELWRGVLGIEKIGIHDNFFEMGGNSLVATQLLARLCKAFSTEIPLRTVFESATVAQLAKVLAPHSLVVAPNAQPASEAGHDVAAAPAAAAAAPALIESGRRQPALVPWRRPERLPLSYAQQRLWFMNRLDTAGTEYNLSDALRLRGELDRAALELAINTLVARHEILRTRFAEVEGEPFQIIEPELQVLVPFEDLSALDKAAQQERVTAQMREAGQPFDLAHGPLVRLRLLKLDDRQHIFLRTFHHIIIDGWSFSIFNHELATLYQAFHQKQENPLPSLPVQYADFALWQRSRLDEEVLAGHFQYWKEQLSGIPEQLALPQDRPRPSMQTFAAEAYRMHLAAGPLQALKQLSNNLQATLYMTLLAAFAVLLHRYSGQDDIVVGSPIANRRDSQLEQLIGLFVNSLVMRMRIRSGESFRELLGQVRLTALEAYAHQDLSFERLVEELAPQRNLNITPIFQVLFALQNTPAAPQHLEDLIIEQVPRDPQSVPADLEVHVFERQEQLLFYWLYKSELFDRWRMEQMARHYVCLLEAVLADPDQPVNQFDLLSDGEKHQVLREWNGDEALPDRHQTISELFEAQARRTPTAVALSFHGLELTYAELDRRANQLGHYLRRMGVGPEVCVGVCIERGPEMIVALLGIFKGGGTYVPLDPAFPAERLAYMIQDTATRMVLTQSQLRSLLPAETHLLDLESEFKSIAAESWEQPSPLASAENAAYIIYTSGSTGRPKGVVIEHRNVHNMVLAQHAAFAPQETDRVLQFFSFSFDVSIFATLMALCSGARLVLSTSDELLPGPALQHLLQTEEITIGVLPPIVLDHFPAASLPELRKIIVGGEPWSEELLKTWGEGRQFFNSYGPTETTVQAAVGECRTGEGRPSIGCPIVNARIYLLDEQSRPVPVGVAGELYIAGEGVGRGYLDNALTAEKYLPDPFINKPGSRMYRTGDWARWLSDGRIDLLGRKDEQIKIRGYRVELGEIESVLGQHPSVFQCAAMVRQTDHRERRLVAYVVPSQSSVLDEDLRAYLKNKLPEYMVPSQFVMMEQLPLNSSGKVDRHALPDVEFGIADVGRPPRTPEEEILCQIFADVLGMSHVSIDGNFFDLGGHSLMATRLVSRVRSVLAAELPLRAVFESPTVAGLAPHLRQGGTWTPLVARVRPERLPMSYAQQRLWFLDQLESKSTEYHIPETLRLRGPLDYHAFYRAIAALVERHEILRTCFFQATDGQPVQIIKSHTEIDLPLEDLTKLSQDLQRQSVAAAMRYEREQPFDLAHGPMLRMKLLKLGEDEHILLRTFHHITTDGWSQGIFNRELAALYQAFHEDQPNPLEPLSIQYADFALWQRQWLDEKLKDQLSYWKDRLSGIPEELALPKDRPRPPRQTFAAGACHVSLTFGQVAALKRLCQSTQATLYMMLLSAFAVLLQRYSGQDDIVLGSPIANRQDEQLENLIGFFVNSLVLRVQVTPDQSFRELLTQVRAMALDAYRHQDLPFERLVEELSPQRSLNRAPIYQVLFIWQNAPMEGPRLMDLEVAHLPSQEFQTQFDLELQAMEKDGAIQLYWLYNRDLFDAWRIEQMASHFLRIVDAAINSPADRLYLLPILEKEEQQRLLVEWNSTERPYTTGSLVHTLFEQQAARIPRAVAVVCENAQITYGELNERSNQLAHHLRELGVRPDERVAICLESGLQMFLGLLGILKAGAAYIPLDPKYPSERLRYMLEDSHASVILTEQTAVAALPAFAGTVIRLDEQWSEIATRSSSNPAPVAAPENLAYVVYTSGSTGMPKGVAVEHRQLCNQLLWAAEALELTSTDRVLQKASCSFDVSVLETLLPLTRGARVISAKPEGGQDLDYLVRLGIHCAVTYVDLVPSLLEGLLIHPLISRWTSLRVVSCGGEPLQSQLVNAFYQALPAALLWNAYGPTETTVQSTYAVCAPGNSSVAIGKPIANTHVYVLDRWLSPLPAGVAGELFIAGAGVARGYLNRSDLTAACYIPDPFGARPGSRMYRTGDRVRWKVDGDLEFLGRDDDQVKIRGFRIELGEIESALGQCPDVRQAVVLAREHDSGNKQLVAYVIAREPQSLSATQLRDYIKNRLPDYMTPYHFVFLEHLPLTPGGKVNRGALPKPQQPAQDVPVAPRTALEQLLAKAWQQALSLDRVSLDDNFFDLGAHSLLVARVRFVLGEQLRRDISLMDFFTYPTIRSLARRLEQTEEKPISISDSQERAARQKSNLRMRRQRALEREQQQEAFND